MQDQDLECCATKEAEAPAAAPTGSAAKDPSIGLKLRAESPEDLVVMSSVLQDAVTIPADMTYVQASRRFALMLNRYVWEHDDAALCRRIRCGLHFNDVIRVSAKNIPQKLRSTPLELLALHGEPGPDGTAAVLMLFAGGGAIRLEVECIDGYLSDIGEPWLAKCRPNHQL